MSAPLNNSATNDEASCRLAEAVRELGSIGKKPFAIAGMHILQTAVRGTGARHVTLWNAADDGKGLKLHFRTTSREAVHSPGAIEISLPHLNAHKTPGIWRAGIDCQFEKLAANLHAPAGTEILCVIGVNLGESRNGLLVFDHAEPLDIDIGQLEIFLQLVTARLEIADLAETATSYQAAPDDSLRQSHLALTDNGLRDLFYFAPTAMMLAEPDEARPIAVNRHALDLLGISTESTTDIRTSQFWDDLRDRDQFMQQVLERGFVRGYRAQLVRADGSRFWARVSATAIEYDGKSSLISSITDVSDMVAAEEVLNRTQQTLTTLLEASPFPLVVTQLDNGVVRYCNRKAADMFETPLSGLLGHTAPEFYVDPSDRTYFLEKLRATGKVEGFVTRLKTTGGDAFWAMLNAKTLELNGEHVFMVAFADVTRQKKKEEELEDLAFKDALTNTYNRRYFTEAAQMELARCARNERAPALALLDVDHFKRVNDNRGHDTGDEVLREFAQIVQGLLRKTDILARYGGEEFAVLLPETDTATAHAIIERIRLVIASHVFECREGEVSITFSAGITAAETNSDYRSLVSDADRALYTAKRTGRNRVHIRERD